MDIGGRVGRVRRIARDGGCIDVGRSRRVRSDGVDVAMGRAQWWGAGSRRMSRVRESPGTVGGGTGETDVDRSF